MPWPVNPWANPKSQPFSEVGSQSAAVTGELYDWGVQFEKGLQQSVIGGVKQRLAYPYLPIHYAVERGQDVFIDISGAARWIAENPEQTGRTVGQAMDVAAAAAVGKRLGVNPSAVTQGVTSGVTAGVVSGLGDGGDETAPQSATEPENVDTIPPDVVRDIRAEFGGSRGVGPDSDCPSFVAAAIERGYGPKAIENSFPECSQWLTRNTKSM